LPSIQECLDVPGKVLDVKAAYFLGEQFPFVVKKTGAASPDLREEQHLRGKQGAEYLLLEANETQGKRDAQHQQRYVKPEA